MFFCFLFLFCGLISPIESHDKPNISHTIIHHKEFFFNYQDIQYVKDIYNKIYINSKPKSQQEQRDNSENQGLEDLNEEQIIKIMKLMIIMYYSIKNSVPEHLEAIIGLTNSQYKDNIQEIINQIKDYDEQKKEQINIIIHMIINRKSIMQFMFNSLDHNYREDHKKTHTYSYLVITGYYVTIPPKLQTFQSILKSKFKPNFKKYSGQYNKLALSTILLDHKVVDKVQINYKNKSFKIFLHMTELQEDITYNLAIFSFEDITLANKYCKILKSSPSVSLDLFKEFLSTQKIKFEYMSNHYSAVDLPPAILHQMENKNINEPIACGSQLIVILSKTFNRPMLPSNKQQEQRNFEKIERFFEKYMNNYEETLNIFKNKKNTKKNKNATKKI